MVPRTVYAWTIYVVTSLYVMFTALYNVIACCQVSSQWLHVVMHKQGAKLDIRRCCNAGENAYRVLYSLNFQVLKFLRVATFP